MMITKKIGNAGEERAALFLCGQGMRIVERNYRWAYGEVDIIALDNGTLVFAEVKTSAAYTLESVAWTVNEKKRRKIIETAKFFLSNHREYRDMPVRFDILFLTPDDGHPSVTHLAGAFGERV
jgi:putative endonuclease